MAKHAAASRKKIPLLLYFCKLALQLSIRYLTVTGPALRQYSSTGSTSGSDGETRYPTFRARCFDKRWLPLSGESLAVRTSPSGTSPRHHGAISSPRSPPSSCHRDCLCPASRVVGRPILCNSVSCIFSTARGWAREAPCQYPARHGALSIGWWIPLSGRGRYNRLGIEHVMSSCRLVECQRFLMVCPRFGT